MLPIIELESGSVDITKIGFGLDANLLQLLSKLLTFIVDGFPLLIRSLGGNTARDNDSLDSSDTRGKDQTLVITVGHNHDTDRPGGQTPRVLPDIDFALPRRIVGILNDDVEHFRAREVLSETVRGGSLDTTSGSGDEPFDSGSVQSTGEFLLL